MRARLVGVLALCTAVASGCSLQLLGAPRGDVTMTATFDDVVDLVEGNTVQTSNVVIGSVTRVGVEDYRAKVTMSLTDGHRIPAGTRAVIRRTSLFGEHFVDLVFPEGLDPDTAVYLADRGAITETDTDPEVEEFAAQAGRMIQALAADDVAAIVQAGADALGGRGPELNRLISQLAQYTAGLETQFGAFGAVIDNAARLTAVLEPTGNEFGAMIDAAAATTQTLTATRDQFFTALREFNALAATAGRVILSHLDAYTRLLGEADTFLQPLAAHRDLLAQLADNLELFVPKIPRAVSEGQILAAAWIDPRFTPQLGGLPAYLQELLEALFGGVGG